ncbi:calcium-binding protein [candidate division BRC1 bacterium SM23_51]|nr:MAG: calcium-binding protein [candidate division BRC1 bacterium SM23_51]
MPRVERDEAREHRITMEIICDAYGPEEQALGWYCYLEDKLRFPFRARSVRERRISPLKVGEEVHVIGLSPEDDCMHEMFVEIQWSGRTVGVPLSQLEAVEADSEMEEAIADWHYWVARGYQF